MRDIKKEYMSSKERVISTFKRQVTDRIPLINPTSIANIECMQETKAFFPTAHNDAAKMALLASAGYEILKFDTIAPYFGVYNEAAALGCDVNWSKADMLPEIKTNVLKDLFDFKLPANYLDRKPIKTIINAIKLIKKKYNNDIAIIGKVIGPWSLSFNLYGIQNMLTCLVLDKEKVKSLVQALKTATLVFAEAQIDAGADIITISDDAVGDLISIGGYKDIILPIHKELNSLIRKKAYTILHLNGVIIDKIELFISAEFDALSFDSRNTVHKTVQKANNKILLAGCINNPHTLLNGNEEDVKREVIDCLKNGIDFIAPECAIPCNVPNRNLLTIIKVIKDYYNIR